MNKNPGIGVMINMLGGNRESAEAFQAVIGQKISKLWLDPGDDNALHFEFEDGRKGKLFDDGRSCCESRYMRTDDELGYYVGSILLGASVQDGPNEPDEYGDHEVQFLKVTTDRGVFTMASHNEHNGYYGGFWVIYQDETPSEGETNS